LFFKLCTAENGLRVIQDGGVGVLDASISSGTGKWGWDESGVCCFP